MKKLAGLKRRLKKRSVSVERGRNRVVYIMGSYVVKVPLCDAGIVDNDWEGSVCNLSDYDEEDVRFARTRMVLIKGIPIVLMEYVQYATDEQIKDRIGYVPDWVRSVDCGQVGFNKRGQLVAFDYGIR